MKSKTYSVILFLLLTITVTNSYAAVIDDRNPKKERIAVMTDEQKAARIEEIRSRVNEIRSMNKSELTKADRKALKKELKEMNKEARAIKGGVYLSIGAIIIIILLLILLL